MVVIPIKGRGAEPTPEQQLKLDWAASLREHVEERGFTVKGFHHDLTELGAKVSLQAVYAWLNATASPSPINQAYCAAVLKAPAHRLFPLPKVA